METPLYETSSEKVIERVPVTKDVARLNPFSKPKLNVGVGLTVFTLIIELDPDTLKLSISPLNLLLSTVTFKVVLIFCEGVKSTVYTVEDIFLKFENVPDVIVEISSIEKSAVASEIVKVISAVSPFIKKESLDVIVICGFVGIVQVNVLDALLFKSIVFNPCPPCFLTVNLSSCKVILIVPDWIVELNKPVKVVLDVCEKFKSVPLVILKSAALRVFVKLKISLSLTPVIEKFNVLEALELYPPEGKSSELINRLGFLWTVTENGLSVLPGILEISPPSSSPKKAKKKDFAFNPVNAVKSWGEVQDQVALPFESSEKIAGCVSYRSKSTGICSNVTVSLSGSE